MGQRFPSEKREIVDPVTKATLTLLTNNPGGDSKIYQTHPQWTSDGRHIIFRSSKRAADGSGQAFAVEQATGTIIQLTEGPGVNIGTLNVARRSNKLYYLRAQDGRTRLIELDLDKLFADSAAGKVRQLVEEEGNPELKLRVFVQGGGCSGFQYGFTFDEIVNEDDTTMTKNGVSLLIDAMSYQYLVGAEIDYKEDLQGAQFVIKNPNASTTCGCGSSFSV